MPPQELTFLKKISNNIFVNYIYDIALASNLDKDINILTY